MKEQIKIIAVAICLVFCLITLIGIGYEIVINVDRAYIILVTSILGIFLSFVLAKSIIQGND